MAGEKDGWGTPRKSDYEVGYCKPPKEGQFKKGKSGNPRGRPKGRPNLRRMMDEFLAEKVTVSTNGRQERVHRDEALMMAAYSKAMKGDARSIKFFMEEIASRPSHEPQNNVVGIKLVKVE